MAVDFGGLDYTITVRDQFSSNVDAFRAGITGARADFRKLKTELAAPIRSSGQRELTRATRDQATAQRAATRELRRAARDQREAGRRSGIRAAALKSLNRETRNQAIAQERARLAVQRQLVNSRRLATVEQQRVVASAALTRILERRTASENILSEAQARGVTLSTEELNKLKLLTVEQERLLLAKKKLAEQESVAGDKESRRIRAEVEALKVQNRELQKQATLKALAARGLGPGGQPLPPQQENKTFRDRIRNFLQLDKSQKAATASANRFSFTFRRLIGILAAFTVVRLIVRGFTNLVRQLILFNANIEQSRLGIAALFTAVGDVRDATGAAANSAQRLALAQGEAARQTALLRREALATAATFDTLLETFQVAVAPGLVAGLDIDEIREFTVRISQAAAAIGLQQNQLAEEIRSILSGTIQARTTRIAVALGITNEDIRLAREAGVLTEFLNERFSAFKQAGEEALKTFNALLTNVQDSILLLFESGGLEFFNELKGLLKDTLDLVVQTNIGDALEPNPGAVAVVRAIADGLQAAVARARELISDQGLGGLEGLAQAIGQTINIISAVFTPVIAGVLAGFNDIRKAVQALGELLKDLGLNEIFGGDIIAEGIKQLVRFVTVVGLLAAGALVVLGAFKAIGAAIFLTIGSLTTVAGRIAAGRAAVILLVLAFKQVVENIIGAKVGFASFIRIVAAAVTTAFKRLIIQITASVSNLFDALLILSVFVFKSIANILFTIGNGVLSLFATVSDTAASILKDTIAAQKELNDLADKSILKLEKQILLRDRERKAALRAADLELARQKDEAIEESRDKAADLRTTLGEIPGIIDRSRQPLTAQAAILKELTADAQKAADALRFSDETIGLGGGALELRTIQFETLISLREKGLKLATQEQDTQRELQTLELNRIRNQRLFNRASVGNQQLIKETVANNKEILAARRKLAEAESRVVVTRLKLKNAAEDEKAAIQEQIELSEKQEAGAQNRLRLLELEQDGLTNILNRINETKESQEEIQKIIEDRVLNEGNEIVLQERRRAIAADILELDRRARDTENDRLALVAQRLALESTEAIRTGRAELAAERGALADSELPRFAQEALAIQNRITLLTQENDIRREKAALQIASNEQTLLDLENSIKASSLVNQDLFASENIALLTSQRAILEETLNEEKAKGLDGSKAVVEVTEDLLVETDRVLKALRAIDETEKFINLSKEENLILTERQRVKTEELEKARRKALDLGVPSFTEQLSNAIDESLRRLETIGVPIIQKFSDFASQAIVDAFDPTKDVNLKERFARFFQDIAKQILALTIQIAILRAFGGTGSAAAIGAAQGRRVPSFSRGGNVGPWGDAKGFDGGGVPNTPAKPSARPTGLPPTDKVPIWASAGEWVIRRASAAKYGDSVMSAINRGLINPTALRSLVGVRGRHSRRHSGQGFQEGGLISETLAAQQANEDRATEQQEDQPIQILPTLVAGPQTMRRLIDGGSEELLDFMRENNTVISSADQLPG